MISFIIGFDNHITKDHNLWHYLYFIMYLKIKEKTEYTGPEQYVSECIEHRVRSFVPIQVWISKTVL